jgi:UDP-N-acetylglucosamine 2-epimerase (non-hydrolysing)
MKISIILGTRPEIIKFSPIIRECQRLALDYFILHTGQHYSYNMDQIFFDQLNLPQPKFNLDIGSGSHAEQTGKMMIAIEKVLQKEKPDTVLVEGDTNTVLAGALAATKLGIKVGHVEAGLRSYDRRMPEEINRILVDHCSDHLFVPTEKSKQTLIGEGIPEEKIFVTGNTIVDAVLQNLDIAKSRTDNSGFETINEYFLATVHRQENVDDHIRLQNILRSLELAQEAFNIEVVFPIHPRTKEQLGNIDSKMDSVHFVEPFDYLAFLKLESNAKLIFTDSGGVQEEACVLGVPCITLRDNTERPETLEIGANLLAGSDPNKIIDMAKWLFENANSWECPYGDGKAGQKIIDHLHQNPCTPQNQVRDNSEIA